MGIKNVLEVSQRTLRALFFSVIKLIIFEFNDIIKVSKLQIYKLVSLYNQYMDAQMESEALRTLITQSYFQEYFNCIKQPHLGNLTKQYIFYHNTEPVFTIINDNLAIPISPVHYVVFQQKQQTKLTQLNYRNLSSHVKSKAKLQITNQDIYLYELKLKIENFKYFGISNYNKVLSEQGEENKMNIQLFQQQQIACLQERGLYYFPVFQDYSGYLRLQGFVNYNSKQFIFLNGNICKQIIEKAGLQAEGTLKLGNENIGIAGINIILQIEWPELKNIFLWWNNLYFEGIQKLVSLPNLASIKYMDLRKNFVCQKSFELICSKKLSSLEELNINGNQIVSIKSICNGKMVNLKKLDIQNNKISDSGYELEGLSCNHSMLQFLNLNSNALLGKSLGKIQLEMLHTLYLSSNFIETCEQLPRAYLPNISFLSLYGNRIYSLQWLKKAQFIHLQTLWLQKNLLNEIKIGECNLPKLSKWRLQFGNNDRIMGQNLYWIFKANNQQKKQVCAKARQRIKKAYWMKNLASIEKSTKNKFYISESNLI